MTSIISRSVYAVACSSSTLECKVVCTHVPFRSSDIITYILNVGVDKAWRSICEDHVPPRLGSLPCVFANEALGISGFIYWFAAGISHIAALDVEAETFYIVLRPEECQGRFINYAPSSRFLCFVARGDSMREWQFWELVDC